MTEDKKAKITAENKTDAATEKLVLTMDKITFDQLAHLARLDNTDTYAFANKILAEYVEDNEFKLDAHLNPIDAADKADRLFAEAVKMQQAMTAHAPRSRERISAEAAFITVLQRAAALFAEITRKAKGSEIEKHIQLRMTQISALCDDQLNEEKDAS